MLPDPAAAPADGTGQARWRFADVEFDDAEYRLRVAGKPVVSEPRPLRLLLELLRHVNEVVTKEELLDAVWEGRLTVDHVLANAVSKLRMALGEAGAARVVTVPRVGYKLLGPVQRLEARAVAATVSLLAAGREVPGRDGYVLERALGQGARSDVWLGRHGKLGHAHVFKFADDGARLAALKREYTLYRVLRQELGQRDDIANVIGTNFASPPYFLECAYGGRSLLEWADAADTLAAMTVPQRLALFLQMAAAVSAAHSVGVLHKDLKPGNILIDGEPGGWRAQLTDFGSGRLLDAGRLQALQVTALGLTHTEDVTPESMSGTFIYLAPEVMAGQSPSMQSDVYALGVVLYQLLVGQLRQPLVTGWQRSIADPLLQQDVAAATEGQPERRIKSVAELIARLQTLETRRADGVAQQRQQDALAEAARRLQQGRARRPWVAGAVLSLVLGLAASLYFQQQTRHALATASASAGRAEAINEFMARDLLFPADAWREGGNRQVTLLELARHAAQALPQRFQGQPRMEATVRHHIGRAFERMSSFSEAIRQYIDAIALLQPLVPANDVELLTLQFERTLLNLLMQEPQQARQRFDEATAAAGPALLGSPTELAVLHGRAQVDVLLNDGHVDQAVAAARQLVVLADQVPSHNGVNRIEAQYHLGVALAAQHDEAGLAAVLGKLAAVPKQQQSEGALAAARVLMAKASLQRRAGQVPEAEQTMLEVERRLTRAPMPSEFHIGYLHAEMGSMYQSADKLDQAAVHYAQALQSLRRALGDDHHVTRAVGVDQAAVELDRCHFNAALGLLQAGRAWIQQNSGPRTLTDSEFSYARALIGTHQPKPALEVLAQLKAWGASASTDNWLGPQGHGAPQVRAYTGVAMAMLGQVSEGRSMVRTALADMRRLQVEAPIRLRFERWLESPDSQKQCTLQAAV